MKSEMGVNGICSFNAFVPDFVYMEKKSWFTHNMYIQWGWVASNFIGCDHHFWRNRYPDISAQWHFYVVRGVQWNIARCMQKQLSNRTTIMTVCYYYDGLILTLYHSTFTLKPCMLQSDIKLFLCILKTNENIVPNRPPIVLNGYTSESFGFA